jgi:hypothetical protein
MRIGCVAMVVVCLQACGEPPDAGKVEDCSPVLARVGDIRLCAADVELLSGQAAELRRELGLEAGETGRLDLAVEFLALVQLDSVAEAKKGPLVRGYLDRMFKEAEARPVTDAELERAHRDEIRTYLTSGESDIFQPTLIDAAAITVGCFPDGHPPADGEEPVLTMQQAGELVKEIAAACGERVADLDDFLAIARKFMRGNPTVDVQEFSRVYQDARLARTPHPLHQVITTLEGNGAVAAPLEGPGAYFIVRRGVTYPGEGEDPAEIKEELSSRVLLSRKQAAFRERLSQLQKRYRVRIWPERLRGPE